tara:strand:+ start:407 stop:637 length:231 start_codon:yes stop_codon:yes gene_type:complete
LVLDQVTENVQFVYNIFQVVVQQEELPLQLQDLLLVVLVVEEILEPQQAKQEQQILAAVVEPELNQMVLAEQVVLV